MISVKPVVVVAMLTLAGAAVAQEKPDEQRIAGLIEQLAARSREDPAGQLIGVQDLPQIAKDLLLGMAKPGLGTVQWDGIREEPS